MKIFKTAVAVLLSAAIFSATAPAVSADDGVLANVITEYNYDGLLAPFNDGYTSASAAVGAPDVSAEAAVLIEANTGRIIFEKNPHEQLAPASITKIMSLLLVMEAIDSGALSLETVITASEHACSMGGSQIWLEPSEQMTVDELLKATVIGSANDATVALGEAVAGSEEGFVRMMNERARVLGMKDTNFVNCTGLDAEGHVTSAADVATMSAELLRYPLIKNYSTVWMDSLRGGEFGLVNTNKLVRYYDGCVGLKTGTTDSAGHCLSAAAERDGMTLCAVVMKAPSSDDRFTSARKLLDYGFANWCFVSVGVEPEELSDIPVKNGVEKKVSPRAGEAKNFLVERSLRDGITKEIELESEIQAPVYAGQQVGTARVMAGGSEIGTIRISAAETIEKMSFGKALLILLNEAFTF